jgi:hypothetical protein
VDVLAAKFVLLQILSGRQAWTRFARRFLCLLLFAMTIAGGAEGADPPPRLTGPAVPLAIGDFDGDRRPDLAGVQVGQSDLSQTDYWIQLQLSAAGRQTIRVVASSGGLQIAARDVNGDNAPDLVLTTAWSNQPVAILLNDGHGTFSRADPTSFPEAFSDANTGWSVGDNEQLIGSAGAPPQAPAVACGVPGRLLNIRAQTGGLPSSKPVFIGDVSLGSHLGRAPPCEASPL